MKQQITKTVGMFILALGLIVQMSQAQAEETPAALDVETEIDVTGFYMEGGGDFFFPVGNDTSLELDDSIFVPTKMGLGGGGQVGIGFDTKWASLGTKLRADFFKGEQPGRNITGAIYQWDIAELKLYVVDWFRKKPGKWRPYLLGAGGYNINSAHLFGAQGNFGGGVHYHFTKNAYLGLEGTYRWFAVGDSVSSIATALNIGYRF